ncbi:MAG: right-handed parallel beta-helix repeat-containing protein [Paramuribaculum sp.]|nr:right-handed parallel beta-helix repeat-containing protein [Paramuribaculum sp.]
MKKSIFFLLLSSAIAMSAQTATDTIYAKDFGIRPNTYRNLTTSFQKLLDSCGKRHGAVIVLEKGRYDIWPEGAVRKEIYISNTSSESECPSKEKTLGLHFNKINGLTFDGQGAELIFHGSITPIALDSCRNVTIKNLTMDFERPAGSELTFAEVSPGKVIVKVHPDTRYEIRDSLINLIGEGWRSNIIHCIKYTPSNKQFRYSTDYSVLAKSPVCEIAPGLLQFATPADFLPEVGSTLTLRDIIRNQVGFLNLCSSGTTLQDVNVRYMHGLGIVSQFSRDITMNRVNCMPSPESGRILASSADFMHFSGCSGFIRISDCNYSGAQDDAINVHGTNLRIVESEAPNRAVVRFMHPQTYGFMAYQPGDTVAFVNPSSMLRTSYAVVTSVKMVNPRHLELTFDKQIPSDIVLNSTCVENMSATPTVHISGCNISRLSTRGILMTTPRKAVIENCRFEGLGMAAILIEGDAQGWYESGPVTDLTIKNNTFVNCNYAGPQQGATIVFNPSNSEINFKKPVHRNINIIGNTFYTKGRPVLYAKSTSDILFFGNAVPDNNDPTFIFVGCSDVEITGNTMQTPRVEQKDCRKISVRRQSSAR